MAEGMFQITGITSGIDWGQIIDEIINAERKTEDVWKNEIEQLNLKKGLYEEFLATFNDLRRSLDPLRLGIATSGKKVDTQSLTPGIDADSIIEVKATNSAVNGEYDIDITSLAQKHMVASDVFADPSAALNVTGDFQISQNGKTATIHVSLSDSLNDIASAINQAATDNEMDIKATVWEGQLIVESTKTGTDYAISFTDSADVPGSTTSTEVLETIGLLDDSKNIKNQLQAATDAEFTMNGYPVVRSSNTITDLITGVTLTLKSTGHVLVNISDDVESVKESLKNFIDAYNNAIEWISVRLTEDKVEDPKSDLEKRRGMLRGDMLLWQAKTRMRQLVSDPVSGLDIDRFSEIGIMTESVDYGKSGKLEFDEAKFDQKFAENPQQVKELIQSVATRLYNFVESYASNVPVQTGPIVSKEGRIPNRIDLITRRITDLQKQIADFEKRLDIKRRGLLQKFMMMENALAQMQEQSSWLAGIVSQLGVPSAPTVGGK